MPNNLPHIAAILEEQGHTTHTTNNNRTLIIKTTTPHPWHKTKTTTHIHTLTQDDNNINIGDTHGNILRTYQLENPHIWTQITTYLQTNPKNDPHTPAKTDTRHIIGDLLENHIRHRK